MAEPKEKSTVPTGIFISDAAIGRAVRCSSIWVAKHFTRTILPALVAVLGTLGGYAVGDSSHSPEAHPSLSLNATAPGSSATISSPAEGDHVARCTSVSGSATLSPGDRIWILVEAKILLVYYLEGTATTSPTANPAVVDWNYRATLGSKNTSASYAIFAVVADHTTSDFLTGIIDGASLKRVSDGLADSSLPPGIIAKSPVNVQRVASENAECA